MQGPWYPDRPTREGGRPTSEDVQLEPGRVFAGHRVGSLLGRGGMGLVYRAVDQRLGRAVALKVIAGEAAADPRFRLRFLRESALLASLEHPHILPVYAAGEEEGLLYLTMRLVPEHDLGRLLACRGRLAPAHAVAIVAQVAQALDAAHARGVVHRDVTPGNVLLTGAFGDEHAYLADFGLAKPAGSGTLTDTGRFVGTLDYMAPEQRRGRGVGPSADVYALGVVLYQALSGRLPELEERCPPPSLHELWPDIPAPMDAVVRRAMAADPAARFPSAGALAAAARAAIASPSPAAAGPVGSIASGEAAPSVAGDDDDRGPGPPAAPGVDREARWSAGRRRPWTAAVAAAALLAAGGAALWSVEDRAGRPGPGGSAAVTTGLPRAAGPTGTGPPPSPTTARPADGPVRSRVVCARELRVRDAPLALSEGARVIGLLVRGDAFDLERAGDGGWAYGLARGSVNRRGWVLRSYLGPPCPG